MLRKQLISSVGLLLGALILLSESGALGGSYFDDLKSKQKIEEDRLEIEGGESKVNFSFNFDDCDPGCLHSADKILVGSRFFVSYNSAPSGERFVRVSLYLLFCSLKVYFC